MSGKLGITLTHRINLRQAFLEAAGKEEVVFACDQATENPGGSWSLKFVIKDAAGRLLHWDEAGPVYRNEVENELVTNNNETGLQIGYTLHWSGEGTSEYESSITSLDVYCASTQRFADADGFDAVGFRGLHGNGAGGMMGQARNAARRRATSVHSVASPSRPLLFTPRIAKIFEQNYALQDGHFTIKCKVDVVPRDPAPAGVVMGSCVSATIRGIQNQEQEQSVVTVGQQSYLGLFHGEPFDRDPFTDCVVHFGDKVYHCHKNVLGSQEGVFKAQLTSTIAGPSVSNDVIHIDFPGADLLDVQAVDAFMHMLYAPSHVTAEEHST